jgi:hypothetical protein
VTAKADLKGQTIDIKGKRYLVLTCTFRQAGDRHAPGFAMLLVNEAGELAQHMVGIDAPIRIIGGPRPSGATPIAPPTVITWEAVAGIGGRNDPPPMDSAAARDAVNCQPQAADPYRRVFGIDAAANEPLAPQAAAEFRTELEAANKLSGSLAERKAEHARAEKLEEAYWRMDAARAGTGTWKGRPQSERDAFKMVVRWYVDEVADRAAARYPFNATPEMVKAMTAGKVVENRPIAERRRELEGQNEQLQAGLEVDRNRFLGSVPLGVAGLCKCRDSDTCPLGKDRGSQCTREELNGAGHNWHHDKPGTDNGATVGTETIPPMTEDRVPDVRMRELWEEAHAAHNVIAHPVEMQALCEEVNSHRRASTAHHNSKHMQALREELDTAKRLREAVATRLRSEVEEARTIAKTAEIEANRHRDARSTAEHRGNILAEQLDAERAAREADIASARSNEDILRRMVERLESEIATLTKYPTIMPELPRGVYESDGVLFEHIDDEHAVAVRADRHDVRDQWTRRLVAERNHAREVSVALQRRIDAMTRTMGPVAAPCEPTPGPIVVELPEPAPGAMRNAAGNRDGSASPYKRD